MYSYYSSWLIDPLIQGSRVKKGERRGCEIRQRVSKRTVKKVQLNYAKVRLKGIFKRLQLFVSFK